MSLSFCLYPLVKVSQTKIYDVYSKLAYPIPQYLNSTAPLFISGKQRKIYVQLEMLIT